MTYVTVRAPRMCAWWLSGAQAQYASMFSDSVLAVMWPRAAVAAGAFYRYSSASNCETLPGDACWRRVSFHAARLAARGIRGCPIFGAEGGGLSPDCAEGCAEAAACGRPYPHVSTLDPVGNDPWGGGPCPYHY